MVQKSSLKSDLMGKKDEEKKEPSDDDVYGNTMLHISASSGQYSLLEMQVKATDSNPEQVNVQNSIGDTALHVVADLGITAAVDLLVTHSAKVDVKNNEGDTA